MAEILWRDELKDRDEMLRVASRPRLKRSDGQISQKR